MRTIVSDVDVTVMTFAKGNGAFVFVGDEYAGSVERDEIGWTGNAVLGNNPIPSAVAMWDVVRSILHVHARQSLRKVLGL